MTERLDLTDQESWTLENADKIAAILQLTNNEVFREVLEKFIIETVVGAVLTAQLGSLFKGELRDRIDGR